ncbi:hypothetical protein SUGI_0323190 [Cryptomeria japonica]|nr:hypothetical protein SUGI_0323190 [Cryptomeria japonica]
MGDAMSPDIQDYSQTAATESHLSLLQSLLGSHEAAQESLIHSYWKSFNGFAARLSSTHVQQLSNTDDVVSVFESKKAQLLTSRSWDFVGLPLSQQTNHLEYQSDVIVGVLDTGVWPEIESFSDSGLGPIPSKWRGECQTTPDFRACNRKLIGAKFYYKGLGSQPAAGEFISPRDSNGHGTHTSSTAAGNLVRNASLFGLAQGDVRGGVPGARVAMYKVCWSRSCSDVDLLAAFDDAIYDGVDVISVSIGSSTLGILPPPDYFEDCIAIGAFHAMKRGVLTSNAACNDGSLGSVCNFSPWSLTVAASTIDRHFKSQLTLGNRMSFEGNAINTFTMEQPWYPLVYGGDAANVSGGFSSEDSSGCRLYSLDRNKVEGKIVLCYLDPYNLPDGGVNVSGGAGAIIMYNAMNDSAFSFMVPATVISSELGEVVKSYINSTRSPLASIAKSVSGNDLPAPIVASFSSKGPNPITPDLLKPDITAPGVDILAAWSNAAPMSMNPLDKRVVDFNIISGTSMACPHATGAAAYVKSFHPDWSPAAIKSALMTTASTLDATLDGNEAAELGYGAGQINPLKAINPGFEGPPKSFTEN